MGSQLGPRPPTLRRAHGNTCPGFSSVRSGQTYCRKGAGRPGQSRKVVPLPSAKNACSADSVMAQGPADGARGVQQRRTNHPQPRRRQAPEKAPGRGRQNPKGRQAAQTNGQGKRAGKQTNKHTDKTGRQEGKSERASGQAARQASAQTNRQASRQTNTATDGHEDRPPGRGTNRPTSQTRPTDRRAERPDSWEGRGE